MIKLKLIVFSLLLFCALTGLTRVKAQNTDVKLRLSAKVEKEISKKLSGSLEYEHRLDQNLSTFDKAFLEPSVSYDLNKSMKVGAVYRIILDQNKVREQGMEQRVAAYVRYSLEYDDFEFQVKTALQYGFDDLTNSSFSYDQKLISRTSLEVQYNWFGSKFTPFASAELFYHINDPKGGIINQTRMKAGTAYKISKSSKVQVYYLFENEFNVAYPVDAHILGASYSFKF